MWPLHLTLPSSTQLPELSQLNTSSEFLQKRNFSERQRPEVTSRDVSRDFFRSRQASPPRFNLAC